MTAATGEVARVGRSRFWSNSGLPMRLLIVAPYVPWPLDHGGRIRSFHLVRERAKRHEVTLVCLSEELAPDTGPLREICRDLHLVPFRPATIVPLLGLLAAGGAFNVLRFRSKALTRELRALTSRESFDEVQIELAQLWQHAGAARAPFKLLSTQNLEAQVTADLGRTAGSSAKRSLYRVETRRLEAFERAAWEACDACAAVSSADREAIASQIGRPSKVLVVPNGVDAGSFEFATETSGRESSVLLFGGLDYRPNRDAALWFLRRVAPLLGERLPTARVVVAGRGAMRLAGEASGAAVEFRGDVADARQLYATAGAMVVPLRAGGGSRIKILEGMAAGIPIVASRKAVEGLEVEEGVHLRIAEGPEDYVRELATLLRGGEQVAKLRAAARSLIERSHDWGRIVARMERELDTLRARS
jgi:glycosyltransferase involved in cell wall biosynthesis